MTEQEKCVYIGWDMFDVCTRAKYVKNTGLLEVFGFVYADAGELGRWLVERDTQRRSDWLPVNMADLAHTLQTFLSDFYVSATLFEALEPA